MNITIKYIKYVCKSLRDYLLTNPYGIIMLLLLFFTLKSCVVPYIPDQPENDQLLVVEGLISDQYGVNTIKLSKSRPIWTGQNPVHLTECKVWITDDLGHIENLKETSIGTYITDSSTFKGKIGRKYTLHIKTNPANGNLNYESFPMELKPVPEIDSLYYEKKAFTSNHLPVEGCQIFLDTHDPFNNSHFYRWAYSETWEINLPFNVENKVCWRTENSDDIFLKNSSLLAENRVVGFPIKTIDNPIDRLTIKYSIQVKQYSLNEDEYIYWEALKTSLDQQGGLYDIIPPIIPNNIYCLENPDEKTLGYFSVSAISLRRIFIKDSFIGYDESCNSSIKFGLPKFDRNINSPSYGKDTSIVGLDATVWVAEDHTDEDPPYRILVNTRWCSDCTKKGIFGDYRNIKPSFWDEDN
jgi:Domain of unknown function (DUF4249)